jgi:thiol:disulfide interchange protein DsbD
MSNHPPLQIKSAFMSLYSCLAVLLLVSGLATSSLALAIQEDELLDAEVAFAVDAHAQAGNMLIVEYNIADGYYLYRNAFKFNLLNDGLILGTPVFPDGKHKFDDYFGDVEIYRKHLNIQIPFQYTGDTKPQTAELQIVSRGCADLGVCYPPLEQKVSISLTGTTPPSADTDATPVAEQDRLVSALENGTNIITLLVFFSSGLLLAFTPCVFPMIPILSGLIIGQGKSVTTYRAFLLSVVYVLAMAVTYTVAGILVGMSGENVQALFQNPWVLGAFAAVFVLLSLSMFGFYELQMPSGIQSRLTLLSNQQKSNSLLGAAIMGVLSALIVGPCVTAPLIAALIYIANTGDAVLGGAALFALSMGMGLPLIVIGTSAGKLLPKAGAWMNSVKNLFGVLLLAVAIWLLSRVLPDLVTMALYAILLIVSAIYLGALESASEKRNGWFKLRKGIGLILLIYGALLLIGVASGRGTLLQPLQGLTMGSNDANHSEAHVVFQTIKGLDQLEQQLLKESSQQKRPVMLDFYADWCVSCKEMEAFTFSDPQVQATLKSFALLQSDVTENDEQDKNLLKSLNLFGPPAIIFYGPDGREIEGYRVIGYMNAQEFNNHLRNVLEKLRTI